MTWSTLGTRAVRYGILRWTTQKKREIEKILEVCIRSQVVYSKRGVPETETETNRGLRVKNSQDRVRSTDGASRVHGGRSRDGTTDLLYTQEGHFRTFGGDIVVDTFGRE